MQALFSAVGRVYLCCKHARARSGRIRLQHVIVTCPLAREHLANSCKKGTNEVERGLGAAKGAEGVS